MKTQVEAGSTFSDALRRHPKVFDDLYVNLVHAGEVGGLLDTILTRLAKYIEKAMKLKGQIKSAMVYPASDHGSCRYCYHYSHAFCHSNLCKDVS